MPGRLDITGSDARRADQTETVKPSKAAGRDRVLPGPVDDDRAQGYLLFNQTFANRLKAAATAP